VIGEEQAGAARVGDRLEQVALVVVGELRGALVGIVDLGHAAAQVVVVGPGVARRVGDGGGLPGARVGVLGGVVVAGRAVALVLPDLGGLALRVDDLGRGGGAGGRIDADAVAAVDRGGAPLLAAALAED